MKTKLLAIATLAALNQAALAQSSVTVYGLVDLGLGRSIGTQDKAVQESSSGNSRLGFRGTEDLGGGMAAVFQLEHRFRPDVGTESAAGRFWHGTSIVGLRSPYGTVTIGRQFQPAFWLVQNQVDPFAGLTVANLRDVGMRPGGANGGSPNGVATVPRFRISDSIRYEVSRNGLTFGASIAESSQEAGAAAGPDRPVALALNYNSGPVFVGIGYENPQGAKDVLWSVAGRYKFGDATLSIGGSKGKTEPTSRFASLEVRGWLVGLNYQIGAGDIKVGYAAGRVAAVERKRFGLGYHHSLSKRTRLYADVGHEREITDRKTGVDLGIWHSF